MRTTFFLAICVVAGLAVYGGALVAAIVAVGFAAASALAVAFIGSDSEEGRRR